MLKNQKAAVLAKKTSCIVLSGCIAASITGSASVLGLRTCLKTEAAQRIPAAALNPAAASPAAASPAALQTAAAPADSPMPANLQTQASAGPIAYRYYDEEGQNWTSASQEAYTTVTSDMQEFSEGWYVVTGSVEISGRIAVNGNVCLILTDGCSLTAKGIYVPEQTSLTIYAQSDGDAMGRLISRSNGAAAGIGGNGSEDSETHQKSNGKITIYGGNVEAYGGECGAGIGGGKNENGQNITIHGGRITTEAGEKEPESSTAETGGGAGIGGGQNGNGTDIRITGGTITAKGTLAVTNSVDGSTGPGGGGGAGIGGGSKCHGQRIMIIGGTVEAVGSSAGAGIGGGGGDSIDSEYTYGKDITISGGEVTATGGGAGIGGGSSGDGKDINITGGTIHAFSKVNDDGYGSGAGIGGGGGGSGINITITGGEIEAIGGNNGGGAGIGGGNDGSGEFITINGGTVKAAGGSPLSGGQEGAAGIGSGIHHNNPSSSAKSISIKGGVITATGGINAAAIGGGYAATAGSITIENAIVFTEMHSLSDPNLSPIGNGSLPEGDSSPSAQLDRKNCIIFDQNEGKVYNNFAFKKDKFKYDIIIPAGATLNIPAGTTLKLDEGSEWINKGIIQNNGTLLLVSKENSLLLQDSGCLTGNGQFFYTFSNENFSRTEDLSRVYNGKNQHDDIKNHLETQMQVPQNFGGCNFTIHTNNNDLKLPEELRNAGTYDIYAGTDKITFTITPAILQAVSAVPVLTSKTYDGSNQISIQSITITGILEGDEVSVDTQDVIGILADSKAGTYYTVILRGMKLAGRDKDNYFLPPNSDGTAGLENPNPDIQLETAFQITSQQANTSTGSSSAGYTPSQQTAAKQPYLKYKPSVKGWTQIRQEAAGAAPGTSLHIIMNSTSNVPKEMLQTIKGRDICLKLDIGEGISWEINGRDIASAPSGNIHTAVSCKTDSIPSDVITLLSSSVIGIPAHRIEMKHTGTFGSPITLALPLRTEHAGLYANLYRAGGENGTVTYDSCAQVGADGIVRFTVTDAAAYVFVLDDKSHAVSKEIQYEARMQTDGSIRITASDGSAAANMLVTAANGVTYYADAQGLAARNQIVKINGQSYFAKADGAVARNEFCHTQKGSLIYAQADGTLAADRVVTSNGKKYYAKSNCAIARSGFYVTQKGSLVYARATGELYTGQVFRAAGRLYYAKPSGALAKHGFYRTASGDKIYAGSSGAIIAGKLFRVNGKLFYADKKGMVVKNKWISIGGKQYYCGKAFKITKIKK